MILLIVKKISSKIIEKLSSGEFILLQSWITEILSRDLLEEDKKRVKAFLSFTRPEEVMKMISNIERVIQDSLDEAGSKAVEKKIIQIAKEMYSDGESIEKITKYTGLSKEEIIKQTKFN